MILSLTATCYFEWHVAVLLYEGIIGWYQIQATVTKKPPWVYKYHTDSSTCSAEREAGPSLGWTGGEVFWVGTFGGACGSDSRVEVTTGAASGVPFSGILCKMKAAVKFVRECVGIDTVSTHAFHLVCYFHFVGSLTLFGVWMGDRASRSVMGNSSPRLLRSSYTYTTPTREGELRNASAHDCGWVWGNTMRMFHNTVHRPKQRQKNKKTRKARGRPPSNVIIPARLWFHTMQQRNVQRYLNHKEG